jgi:hypothetical protein
VVLRQGMKIDEEGGKATIKVMTWKRSKPNPLIV